jgi:hypothetical protein
MAAYDPDALLAEIRELTGEINEGLSARMDRAERLAELIDRLDGALSGGNRLPAAWTPPVSRCWETHNPGVWPYVARCVQPAEPHTWHEDAKGRGWST